MKTNYNLIMENIINNLTDKPKLLLHACCGICSLSVLEKLKNYFSITVLYYNPNIYPKEEYDLRLDVLKKVIQKTDANIQLMETIYNEEEFNNIAAGYEEEKEGGSRCSRCYNLRLEKTAIIAKEKNFDYFTTTLSVSPYKNSEILNKIGKALEKKYSVNYLYSDFKKKDGYKRSNELAKMYNLYRQDYCGCKYSFNEKKI